MHACTHTHTHIHTHTHTQLHGKLVSRLRVLEEVRQAMDALQQPDVFAAFTTSVAALPPVQLPVR